MCSGTLVVLCYQSYDSPTCEMTATIFLCGIAKTELCSHVQCGVCAVGC